MLKKMLISGGVVLCLLAVFLLIRYDQQQEKQSAGTANDELNKEEQHVSSISEAPDQMDIIADQMSQMTIDEKIGQLFIGSIEGTSLTKKTKDFIVNEHLGGVILFSDNLEDPKQSHKLINNLKQSSAAGAVPLFISIDQEGGRVTRLPGLNPIKSAAEIGQTDAEFAQKQGEVIARQLKAFGFQLNFAPVLDIKSNEKNTVIGDRAYGDNASAVSEIGISVMKGMQTENVIAAVKHFPGHGDTLEDSHEVLPVLNKTMKELKANELIPFQEAIEDGADMVLMGHIIVKELDDKEPASLSPRAVELLREDMGFKGVIITDDLTMGAIADHYDMGAASVKALKAGADIIMIAHGDELLQDGIKGVKQALSEGTLTEEQLNEHVRRILILKHRYNLSDELVEPADVKQLNKELAELYNKQK